MAAVTYETKSQARCLAAVEGDADRSRFVIATLNLRAPNELHVVEFSEDTNELTPIAIYATPHETWDLATCPSAAHAGKVLSVLNEGGASHYAALTSVPVLDGDEPSAAATPTGSRGASAPRAALAESVKLAPSAGSGAAHGLMRQALWNPSEDVGAAVTVQPGALCLWPLDRGDGAPSPSSSCTAAAAFGTGSAGSPDSAADHTAAQGQHLILSACWDLHHVHTLALGSTSGAIATVDLRTMKGACHVGGAHRGCVRVLAYNPNRPYILLSAADDRTMKFWDLRKAGSLGESKSPLSPAPAPASKHAPASPAAGSSTGACLLSLPSVSHHWTTCARFNRFHDLLILTGGTDAIVNLWRVGSVSSAPPSAEPLDGDDGDAEREGEGDGLVRSLTEHDESVYSLVWSAADAWLFASLSLDGKLCAHYVPAAEKYRILL